MYLLLNDVELIEVTNEEVHLSLLRFTVRVLDNVLVLFGSLVQLNLELDDLWIDNSRSMSCISFKNSFEWNLPFHIGSEDPSSNSSSSYRIRRAAEPSSFVHVPYLSHSQRDSFLPRSQQQ